MIIVIIVIILTLKQLKQYFSEKIAAASTGQIVVVVGIRFSFKQNNSLKPQSHGYSLFEKSEEGTLHPVILAHVTGTRGLSLISQSLSPSSTMPTRRYFPHVSWL